MNTESCHDTTEQLHLHTTSAMSVGGLVPGCLVLDQELQVTIQLDSDG